MKKLKLLFFTTIISALAFTASAQKSVEKVGIKTSAVCKMCKQRLDKDVSLSKGVKEANLDLDTKVMWITYYPSKTNTKKLKEAINKIGYDADDYAAVENSHDALPKCCQKTAEAHAD